MLYNRSDEEYGCVRVYQLDVHFVVDAPSLVPPTLQGARLESLGSKELYSDFPIPQRGLAGMPGLEEGRGEPGGKATGLRRHWLLLAALGVLWTTVVYLAWLSIAQNQGHIVYALDDPYNEMDVAKNTAQFGVWGITRHEFSSAPASISWTLLLTLVYLALGPSEVAPLALNTLLASLLLYLAFRMLADYGINRPMTFGTLVSIVFFTPLVPIIFTGLEHVLQSIVSLALLSSAARLLAGGRSSRQLIRSRDGLALLGLASLLPLTRYEGVFLLGVVAVLFMLRRRPLYSVLVAVLGVLPAAVYGLIAASKGWFLVPNGVLIKGTKGGLDVAALDQSFPQQFFVRAVALPHLATLLIAAMVILILVYRRHEGLWQGSTVMLIIFLATTLLHASFVLLFVQIGWFYRYEAYLVVLGLTAIVISLRRSVSARSIPRLSGLVQPKALVVAITAVLLVSPLVVRAYASLEETPRATTYIFENQYQVGLFLRTYYQGQTIAANDIGAINYLADIRLFDIAGVADMDVARAKIGGYYNSTLMGQLAQAKGVKIAVTYSQTLDHWGGTPAGWVEVGRWTVGDIVAKDKTVSFYAVDPLEKEHLMRDLASFSGRLPQRVVQSGAYLALLPPSGGITGDKPVESPRRSRIPSFRN